MFGKQYRYLLISSVLMAVAVVSSSLSEAEEVPAKNPTAESSAATVPA